MFGVVGVFGVFGMFDVFGVFGVFGVAQNIEAFEWPSQTLDGPHPPGDHAISPGWMVECFTCQSCQHMLTHLP